VERERENGRGTGLIGVGGADCREAEKGFVKGV
jgi:hypothetical protein